MSVAVEDHGSKAPRRGGPSWKKARFGVAAAVVAGAAAVLAAPGAAGAAIVPATGEARTAAATVPPPQTFGYTGSQVSVTVPQGVNVARLDVVGAHGGPANQFAGSPKPGGDGAEITGQIAVTAGQVFTVRVGGAGGAGQTVPPSQGPAGGWGATGTGGSGGNSGAFTGGGGGGASGIYNGSGTSDPIAIAGGGGGAGGAGFVVNGGEGGSGGPTPGSGQNGTNPAGGPGGPGGAEAGGPGGPGGNANVVLQGGGGGGGGGGVHGGDGGGFGTIGGGGGGGGGAGSSSDSSGLQDSGVGPANTPLANGYITITWMYIPFTCQNQTVNVAQDSPGVAVQLSCPGPGAPSAFQILSLPAHGYLDNRDLAKGTFTYVPVAGYTGTDSIAFDAVTGDGYTSNTATVTFAVTPKPRPAMSLSASATQVVQGQSPVYTVHMPTGATGQIGFYDTSLPGPDKGIGLAPVVNGVATLAAPTKPLLVGQNVIQASYGGDDTYAANDSNQVTVTVTTP